VGKQIENIGTELLFDRSIENKGTSTTDGKGKFFYKSKNIFKAVKIWK